MNDQRLSIPRRVHLDFAIDTNRINARQKDPDMNLLEKWAANGVIQLEIPQAVAEECGVGINVERRARKAMGYVTSITGGDKHPELQAIFPDWENDRHTIELRSKIEMILFPGGTKNENERNDVRIVLAAAYYDRILITNDGDSKTQPGGILGGRDELAKIRVSVMRPSDAVLRVRKFVTDRDNLVLLANKAGAPIPEWFGND